MKCFLVAAAALVILTSSAMAETGAPKRVPAADAMHEDMRDARKNHGQLHKDRMKLRKERADTRKERMEMRHNKMSAMKEACEKGEKMACERMRHREKMMKQRLEMMQHHKDVNKGRQGALKGKHKGMDNTGSDAPASNAIPSN